MLWRCKVDTFVASFTISQLFSKKLLKIIAKTLRTVICQNYKKIRGMFTFYPIYNKITVKYHSRIFITKFSPYYFKMQFFHELI